MGAGRLAAWAVPVARSLPRIGKASPRSSRPLTYWLVHADGSASAETQRAVPESVSSAYMSWVGAGCSASNRSTARPTPKVATTSTPATAAGNQVRRAVAAGAYR